jgi:hypothetical protein
LTGAAILSVSFSQADKLIASTVLPLKDFDYYVIAGMIASLMWDLRFGRHGADAEIHPPADASRGGAGPQSLS